jgi:hypothetical protein
VLPLPAGREAGLDVGARLYLRHRPERTLLYQIVDEYYPAFKQHLVAQEAYLPAYVDQEFEDYLKCGRLEHGFLRVRCDNCHAEHLVAFSCKRRGFCSSCGAGRMDEVFPAQPIRQWVLSVPYPLRFHPTKAPTAAELSELARTLALRIGRCLERQGLLERDAENSYLVGDEIDAGPLAQLQGASITYRVAIGPQQGRKVFTLQTLPANEGLTGIEAAKVAGFSLHAGVAARADQRDKLERLCRYICRPAPVADAER